MLQLRAWSGWRSVVARFGGAGYDLVGQFSRLASELCGGRFSAESFQTEQCLQGERYINHLFGQRAPPTQGELRGQLQQVLAGLSETDRLEKFRQELYSRREAEVSISDHDVEIVTRRDVQGYLDFVAAQMNFTVEKRFGVRCASKTLGGWLRGVAAVDVDGPQRFPLTVASLTCRIELVESDPTITETVALGEVAEALIFYQLVAPPRNMRDPPQTPDARAISRMARHGVSAQLCFFDLLLQDLAETCRP